MLTVSKDSGPGKADLIEQLKNDVKGRDPGETGAFPLLRFLTENIGCFTTNVRQQQVLPGKKTLEGDVYMENNVVLSMKGICMTFRTEWSRKIHTD